MFALGAPPQSCCLGHFSPGHSSALFSLETRTWQRAERVFNPPAFPHCSLFTSHFWQRKSPRVLLQNTGQERWEVQQMAVGSDTPWNPSPSLWTNPGTGGIPGRILSKGALPNSRGLHSCFRPTHFMATPQYPPGSAWQIHSHSF